MSFSKLKPKPQNIADLKAAVRAIWNDLPGQLVLITNSKSHTGFRWILTSVTLNDLERFKSRYFFTFFTEFDRFVGQLRHSA